MSVRLYRHWLPAATETEVEGSIALTPLALVGRSERSLTSRVASLVRDEGRLHPRTGPRAGPPPEISKPVDHGEGANAFETRRS